MRKAKFAGSFYAAEFDLLDKQIRDSFEGKWGPAALPVSKRSGKVFGGVVPPAGYSYSGGCAAWGYKEIAEAEAADVYVVIGTSHSGVRGIGMEKWETPFGIVDVDEDFARHIVEATSLEAGEEAFAEEHSIEVQLPFLQFICGKGLKIVPIVVGSMDFERAGKIGKGIVEVAQKFGKKICFVISSDFVHYGMDYGFVPFPPDKKRIYELDGKAIEFVKKLDSKGFLDYVRKTGATICGAGAIAVGIEGAKALGAKKGLLLRYYTSGDVLEDYSSAVGYGSVGFK